MNLAPTKDWVLRQRRAWDAEMKALVARGGTIDPKRVKEFEEKMARAEAEAEEHAQAIAGNALGMQAEVIAAAVAAAIKAVKDEEKAEAAEAVKPALAVKKKAPAKKPAAE